MNDATDSRPLDALGVAGMVLCCLLWGGNAVAVKFTASDLPPLGTAGVRFLIALPVIAAACRWLGEPLRVARGLLPLAFLHGTLMALQIATFNLGVSLSEAGRSSVFINVYPLVVAPLAWIWLGERMGARGLSGLGASVIGVAILLAEPLSRGGGLVGDLIVLGSGAVFGFQTVIQKKTFPYIRPATLLLAQSVVATPLVLGLSLVFEGTGRYHFTPSATEGILYQGLGVSGLCFTLWMVLLRRHPAGRLATLSFLSPLFGVGLGHLTRGEPLTPGLLFGGCLVGLGIYLVASDRHAGAPAGESPVASGARAGDT